MRSLGLMTERKWINIWYVGCLLAGLASSVAGALWLFVVDGIFFSDELTLTTSFAVAFLLPIAFALAWPKPSIVQRVIGIAIGIAGTSIGIYALGTLVEMAHRHATTNSG